MNYALGVDLGGTNIKIGLANEKGKILFKDSLPTESQLGTKEVIEKIKKLIKNSLKFAQRRKIKIKGLGLGSPGLVNYREGIIVGGAENIPGWTDIPLKKILEKEFNFPCQIDNDVNLASWGEFTFGAGRGSNNCLCITLGTGIGGGIIIERKLYHGSFNFAGEIGHLTINYEGARCNCGGWGCLEAYAGQQAIVERTKTAIRKGFSTTILKRVKNNLGKITPKIISEEAKKGDLLSKIIIEETGRYIGAALAGVANLLNPEIIIIGGGIAQAGEILFTPIRNSLKRYALTLASQKLRITSTQLGQESGILGGCSRVFELF